MRVVAIVFFVFASAEVCCQNQLPWYVLGSGGQQNHMTASRLLSSTVGQSLVGPAVLTDGSDLDQGFWLPLSTPVGVDESKTSSIVSSIFPNPFSDVATFRIESDVDAQILVKVHSTLGEVVRVMAVHLHATVPSTILFDGLDDQGRPLASGTYHVEVTFTTPQRGQERVLHQLTIVR
jgi:hypothetical protein